MTDQDPSGIASYTQMADHAERWLALEVDRRDFLSSDLPAGRVNADVEDVLLRAAAFETGAVESLYEAVAGATRTIAEGSEGWEDVVAAAGEGARRKFEDQYAAYKAANEYSRSPIYPLRASFLGQLHKIACENQTHLENGKPFRHGEFKLVDNYVLDRFHRPRMYAPVTMVASEVDEAFRIYELLKAEDKPPVMLSAFLHWAIAHIHPYEDGNGRIARIVASIPLLAERGVPLMVFSDRKDPYLQALDEADHNRPRAMVKYTTDRYHDTQQWAKRLSDNRAVSVTTDDLAAEIARIIGAQADNAEPPDVIVDRVIERVGSDIQAELSWVESLNGVSRHEPAGYVSSSGRSLAEKGIAFTVSIAEPIPTTVGEVFTVYIEEWEERRVQVLIGDSLTMNRRVFSLRYSDCTPKLSNEALLQIATYAESEAMRLGIRLKDQLTHTTRARGTLPADNDPSTEKGGS